MCISIFAACAADDAGLGAVCSFKDFKGMDVCREDNTPTYGSR